MASQKLACHVIMNIHIKPDCQDPYDEERLKKIIGLIDKYDCRRYVYFMSANVSVQRQLAVLAPDITRCLGYDAKNPDMVDLAIELGCQKIQLYKPYFDQDMIDRAHRAGIRCNVFWSNRPPEAIGFLKMGIDFILTNGYHVVAHATEKFKKGELPKD